MKAELGGCKKSTTEGDCSPPGGKCLSIVDSHEMWSQGTMDSAALPDNSPAVHENDKKLTKSSYSLNEY